MKVRVLKSTAKALTKQCPVHKRGEPHKPCYTGPSTGLVCAKRRALFRITEPGKMVTISI